MVAKVLRPFEWHSDLVRCVAFSADGAKVVSGSFDWSVRVWSSDTGQASDYSLARRS